MNVTAPVQKSPARQHTVAGSLVSKDKTAGEKSIYEEDEVEIMEKWFLQHREMILENHLLSQMVNSKIDKNGEWVELW